MKSESMRMTCRMTQESLSISTPKLLTRQGTSEEFHPGREVPTLHIYRSVARMCITPVDKKSWVHFPSFQQVFVEYSHFF
jgi:hypothetical protein